MKIKSYTNKENGRTGYYMPLTPLWDGERGTQEAVKILKLYFHFIMLSTNDDPRIKIVVEYRGERLELIAHYKKGFLLIEPEQIVIAECLPDWAG